MVWHIDDGYSSAIRPALWGHDGAVSAAHPLAVSAGQVMLARGGSAADAAIAAQAVLCVVAPDACGLGGDMFALVHDGQRALAINGAGATPQGAVRIADDGPDSITVPGLAGGWAQLHRRWGRLPLGDVLAPAIRLAREGCAVSSMLGRAVQGQRARLIRHGADEWALLGLQAGDRFVQPELADLLDYLGKEGAKVFYQGSVAQAIAERVQARGGAMAVADLAAHETGVVPPLSVAFGGCEVLVQPAPTQGVLLAMALQALEHHAPGDAEHLRIELTEAAFAFRDRAGEGAALLAERLTADPERASGRGGPRAYLHTAGVATADARGLVISSLVSVFDDFGSCTFVPQLGITLNNRAGGFTGGANAPAPGKRPVHTLAPALLRGPQGVLGLATPGADGQVQTLLQVIDRMVRQGQDLAGAIAAPRWRSEGGRLLIEANHPAQAALAARGHNLTPTTAGDMRFGAVACAGYVGAPMAVSDWRRDTWAGVA